MGGAPEASGRRASPLGRLIAWLLARDGAAAFLVVLVAAAVRMPGLPARGGFDGDQGHDMLVLLRLVRDGVVPLLGPPTSIGDIHHGAAYYGLLAPAAAISGADPVAVVTWIAVLGIAAVAATWWLGRLVGGPLVGLVAGLLLAVSPAAIDESIFIWNPNPIPLFAALALGAAWRARTGGRARWWAAALASAGMVAQLHVLGSLLLPVVVALAVGRIRAGGPAGPVVRGLAAGLLAVALLFVPLLIHELGSDFSETRRALAYLAGGGEPSALDPLQRVVFTLVRAIGWPLAGVVTSAPIGAILAVSLVIGLVAWRLVAARGPEGSAVRFLAGTLTWSVIALGAAAPSLSTVVPGLPNDHYHAFLDPVVVVLLALGLRPLLEAGGGRADAGARAVSLVVLAVLVVFMVGRWPAFADANGGWPAARAAGFRIVERAGVGPLAVAGLPRFKTSEGIGFPIEAAGGTAVFVDTVGGAPKGPLPGERLVIVCDRLFERIIGDPCGGPAEDRLAREILAAAGVPLRDLVAIDRFDLSPRTAVSIYAP